MHVITIQQRYRRTDGWTYRPTDDIAATCVLRAVGLKAKWL